MGNDLCRGLLLFADGKPLGKKGLRWLKIHCANLMGKDKEKLDNKVMFIENNLEKIYKMAD
jgi:DNA-directed RNA polymerase